MTELEKVRQALQGLLVMLTVIDQRLIPAKYRELFIQRLKEAHEALGEVDD